MKQFIIRIKDAVARRSEFRFNEPVKWSLNVGQHWAVVGPNGAGKTLFAGYLTGKIPLKEGSVNCNFGKDGVLYDHVKTVTFRDIYSLADYKNMYYQQRWNASDEEEAPFVIDLVRQSAEEQIIRDMFDLFGIEELLEKRIILLSSGELRKFLIVKTLLSQPQVLILDNPYIGLDAPSRDQLDELLKQLSCQRGLQIILILSNPADIPELITHVLPVNQKSCRMPVSKSEFLEDQILMESLFPSVVQPLNLPPKTNFAADYDIVLEMEHIHIQYGRRIILKDLNWTVLKAEKWALLGPNGVGKSTLLSLVCADNPQAYANSFYLFGRKRGTGESIWDIKRKIGYVSPEIHLYYQQDQSCIHIVGSGFFDSIGLHRKCSEEQLRMAGEWMIAFGIGHLVERPFLQLSFGEQRLAILARAFVKDPDLLILDEPLHGLDKSNKLKSLQIISTFCDRPDKTLIYVTHYINEIPLCVDKQFVLKKNK